MTPPSRRWVALRAHAIERVGRGFAALLASSRPHAVLISCYYSLVGMAMCLAARRAGVEAIDVQHGVTVKNPAYEGWSRFPHGGFELLPSRFWFWTPEDARMIADWPEHACRHHRVLVGGHPWMAFWQGDHRLAATLAEEARALRGPKLNVLVTLTCTSGLSPLLRRLLTEAPADWTWWIRLHPRMERERSAIRSWCSEHARGRAHVDAPTDLPLSLLLQAADVHLTHNSTVVQEATATGTPSVLVDRHGLDVYARELASGWTVFAEDPAAIYEALEHQHRRALELPRSRSYPGLARLSDVVADLVGDSRSLDAAETARAPAVARCG